MTATLVSPPIQPRWVGEGTVHIYTAGHDTDLPYLPVTAAFVFATSDQGVALTNVGARGWDLPGGHLEAGEAPRTAAVRELSEEVGLDVAAGELDIVGFFHVTNPPGSSYPPQSVLVFYAVAIGPASPLSAGLECVDARWMGRTEFDVVARQHLWMRLAPKR